MATEYDDATRKVREAVEGAAQKMTDTANLTQHELDALRVQLDEAERRSGEQDS